MASSKLAELCHSQPASQPAPRLGPSWFFVLPETRTDNCCTPGKEKPIPDVTGLWDQRTLRDTDHKRYNNFS
ncbi:unnamed protein product [Sphagnum jensenii]|uniref:Uncharacterized protein n=1 Tax=Sphagnum jensenii TaxID=128206 RepID=A0ABP0WUL0_9BRYO